MYFTNARIWVYGEQVDGKLSKISYELLGIASSIANEIDSKVLMVLCAPKDSLNQECIYYGADYVVNVTSDFSIEALVDLANKMRFIEEPDIIICGATEWGMNLAPQLAVKLNAGLTANCINLQISNKTGRLIQTRPTAFDNLFASIISTSHIQMATIKPNIFAPNQRDKCRTGHVIKYQSFFEKKFFYSQKQIQFTKNDNSGNGNVIVGIGNGVDEEMFHLVEAFAKLIHAPIYGSRAAVANGLIGYERQIGLTGKTIQSKLYIAIGISGSQNHLLGISRNTKIIAVNTDMDAEIVKLADYKIISDAKTFLGSVLE